MKRVLVLLSLMPAHSTVAQESKFQSDLRREGEHIAESCGEFNPKSLGNCVYTLTTDYPFHLALGNLAPLNGFAFGLAFSERFTPNESWRLSWNADAVGAPSGSWRAGAYMKFVHTPATSGVVVRQPGLTTSTEKIAPREFTVIDVFAESTSLKTINFFGSGQQSLESGHSQYGERQTVVGGSVIYPLSGLKGIRRLRPALIGGVTGRFVDIRPTDSSSAPSIQVLYDDNAAPGLSEQDAFVQFHEAIRFKPSIANGRLRFNYLLSAQQFKTSTETLSSFNRWTMDLQHEIPLYSSVASTGPRAFNGPNDCSQSTGGPECPPIQWSRNRQGSISFRLLVSAASTSGGNRVPFYFQPTLGGADINGERGLASYQDYRFRDPNLFLLQESFEHAIWGPFGVFVVSEQGKVTSDRSDLDFEDLTSSTTVGLTLRAGGFPMVNLSFSWGGEGHHFIGSMSPTLLGGSFRPSLY